MDGLDCGVEGRELQGQKSTISDVLFSPRKRRKVDKTFIEVIKTEKLACHGLWLWLWMWILEVDVVGVVITLGQESCEQVGQA